MRIIILLGDVASEFEKAFSLWNGAFPRVANPLILGIVVLMLLNRPQIASP